MSTFTKEVRGLKKLCSKRFRGKDSVHFIPKNVSCERVESGVVLVHKLFSFSPLGEEKIQSLVKATFFPHDAELGNDAENVLTEEGRVEQGLKETDLITNARLNHLVKELGDNGMTKNLVLNVEREGGKEHGDKAHTQKRTNQVVHF